MRAVPSPSSKLDLLGRQGRSLPENGSSIKERKGMELPDTFIQQNQPFISSPRRPDIREEITQFLYQGKNIIFKCSFTSREKNKFIIIL